MTSLAFLPSETLMPDSGAKKTFSGKMLWQGSHPESSAEKLRERATNPPWPSIDLPLNHL
jgi:hypothetical protein